MEQHEDFKRYDVGAAIGDDSEVGELGDKHGHTMWWEAIVDVANDLEPGEDWCCGIYLYLYTEELNPETGEIDRTMVHEETNSISVNTEMTEDEIIEESEDILEEMITIATGAMDDQWSLEAEQSKRPQLVMIDGVSVAI